MRKKSKFHARVFEFAPSKQYQKLLGTIDSPGELHTNMKIPITPFLSNLPIKITVKYLLMKYI